MRAIIQAGYGSPDVLHLRDVEKPTPIDNEVLISVSASLVTAADIMIRKGLPHVGRIFTGLTTPKHPIPGTGFSGVIEAVGKDVTRFKEGNEVFGETNLDFGAHAEYVRMPEDGILATKPAIMTHDEAAPFCYGALTSMNFLKDVAHIRSGQRILINGASGDVGIAAVQIAKYYGADVTGVCSTRNVDLVKSLGADVVVDYTKEDFTRSGQLYDMIFDTVGKVSFSRCKNSLMSRGIYLSPVLGLPLLLQMIWTSRTTSKKARFSATGLRPASQHLPLLEELKEPLESGKIRSVIDRRYPLEQIAEAHRYVESGRKSGHVVIAVHDPGQ